MNGDCVDNEACRPRGKLKRAGVVGLCLIVAYVLASLLNSHMNYTRRASAAQVLPDGVSAVPGRIYFVSFPENRLAASVFGWHPNIGHASLVTSDGCGRIRQYDYGWFVGYENGVIPTDAIGYVDPSSSYGVVRMKAFSQERAARATNDQEVARMILEDMYGHGDTVEIWAKDVDDIGVAERYMEQFAADEHRGSMLWRCWQVGGYRCGNISRQAFDAARGEGHVLDLLWGGFPGSDAPSFGTEKTVFVK